MTRGQYQKIRSWFTKDGLTVAEVVRKAHDLKWKVSRDQIVEVHHLPPADPVGRIVADLRAEVPADRVRAEAAKRHGAKAGRFLVAEAEAAVAAQSAPKGTVRQRGEELVARAREGAAQQREKLNGTLFARRAVTALAQDDLFLDALQERLRTIPWRKMRVGRPPAKRRKPTTRVLNLLLSDLHFQSLIDSRENPLQYGPHEEARRLAAVVLKTADYKRPHRDDTELYVHLAGDIVQNQLHDPRDAAPMAEQHAAALTLLYQALAHLAGEFHKVTVRCTPGNHGRYTARHPSRAVHQKWDSHETAIYFGLKVALQHLPNLTVEILRTPFYTYDSLGQRGFVTHGDTVLSVGVPQRKLDTGALAAKVHQINAAEAARGLQPFGLFATGHVHFYSVSEVPGTSSFMLTNAALVPPDSYATSIGVRWGQCGQALWESVPGRILGDARLLTVGEDEDRDAALETIVKPFTEF